MPFLPHIETLYTLGWIPWVFLFLGINMCLIEWTHKGLMVGCWTAVFALPVRRYEDKPKLLSKLLAGVFCLGTTAMSLYLVFNRQFVFRIDVWACLALMVLAVLMIKDVLLLFLGYVFSWSNLMPTIRQHYRQMWMAFSAILWCVCLLFSRVPVVMQYVWVYWVLLGVFELCILWKTIQVMYRSAISLLHILLYFVTLEILPIGGILLLSVYIIEKL